MNKNRNILRYITAIGALVLMAVLIYYFYTRDPGNPDNLFIECTFNNLTGLDCPGCGGQRSIHHLLHFNLMEALRQNAFFVLSIPYLIPVVYYEIQQLFWRMPKPKNSIFASNKALWIYLIALLIFGIIRNLPFYPF